MKKLLLSAVTLSAFLSIELKAQTVPANNPSYFFERVPFSGALGTDPSKDWTKGWTNFSPNTTNYAEANDLTTLSSNTGLIEITSNTTLDASKVYLMKSIVVVKDGATLTIPAGTIIRAESDVANNHFAILVVERGGKIMAEGTMNNPIIFTSNKATGARTRGDWGGIALLGKAANNQKAVNYNFQLEGYNKLTSYNSGQGGFSGGNDDSDNSGTLKFIRIEYAGLALDVNKEVNALTFASVGNGTIVDYIQASYSNDDSFEWFGGTVNTKHLIAFAGTDDDFDTDFGYRGLNQFGIGYKLKEFYDGTWNANSSSSTSEGFESDNDATGSTETPLTAAVFANYTMVGPIKPGMSYNQLSSTEKGAFRRGARIRRNSAQSIINSVFMGYRNFLMIDGSASITNAGVSSTPDNKKDLRFRGNVLVGLDSTLKIAGITASANGLVEVASNGPLSDLDSWVKTNDGANKIIYSYTKGEALVELNNLSSLDFKPVANALSLSAAVEDSKIPLGLDETVFVDGSFSVYPNPATSTVNVQFELIKNAIITVEIYNLLGTKVATISSNSLNTGSNTISAEVNLSAGVYVVKVSNGTSASAARLVIK